MALISDGRQYAGDACGSYVGVPLVSVTTRSAFSRDGDKAKEKENKQKGSFRFPEAEG